MRFLKGNVVFFALLLLVIMLFVYYTFEGVDSEGENDFSCKVSFAQDYNGGECSVFIDDSLLFVGNPCGTDTVTEMRRYATEKSKVSLYTSQSLLRIVADGDTVQRALQGDREFVIESAGGKITVSAIEK